MTKRLLRMALLYLLLTALLVARVAVLALWPQSAPHLSNYGHQSARRGMDAEHFRSHFIRDGRGRILYSDGTVWHPRAGEVVGVVGLPDVWPSADRSVAEQGRSGLEHTFDPLLSGQPTKAALLTKADGTLVSDRMYRLDGKPGYDVRTTVEPTWQGYAASLLDKYRIQYGALVVLDVKTHHVLAMTGKAGGRRNDWIAVKDAVPGSIFKLVTAAAALESYQVRPTSLFYCTGRPQFAGVRMHCWTHHGWISFVNAVAESCDTVFAALAVQMGAKPIETMARRMGIGTTNVQSIDGIPVLEESVPSLLGRPGFDRGRLANTAIGQEDVRVSPLDAASLASVIADDGHCARPMLVSDIEASSRIRRVFYSQTRTVMSASSARTIGLGMRQAVVSSRGTAHGLWNVLPRSKRSDVAVKTGTAELPGKRVNGWMIGFAPYHHPTIAFAVFVGDGHSSTVHRQVSAMASALLQRVVH